VVVELASLKGKVLGILVFSLLLVGLLQVESVYGQGSLDARFIRIRVTDGIGVKDLVDGGSAKVYSAQPHVWINVTVRNYRLYPGAYLFIKIYINNTLYEVSDKKFLMRDLESEIARWYWKDGFTGPAVTRFKVELWEDRGGTTYLQDTKFFDVSVAWLRVADWSPASLEVQRGLSAASTWSLSFRNGGNDYMYSASVSMVDSAGLQISQQSQNLGDIVSNGVKSVSFSVIAPATMAVTNHTVRFQVAYYDFRGVTVSEAGHSEIKTAVVKVVPISTGISLSLQPVSVKIGEYLTVTGKLLDGNGRPISGQNITVRLDSTVVGLAATDTSGNAVVTYKMNVDAGTYQVRAGYEGSRDYQGSVATINVIVNPLATTLTVSFPSTVTQGKPVTLTATLRDERGNPIQGAAIDFYVSTTKIGSATTGADGTASTSYTPNATGAFQLRAAFMGTRNYAEISSAVSPFTVQFDYVPYIIGAVGVALIVGVLIAAARSRRRKPVPVPVHVTPMERWTVMAVVEHKTSPIPKGEETMLSHFSVCLPLEWRQSPRPGFYEAEGFGVDEKGRQFFFSVRTEGSAVDFAVTGPGSNPATPLTRAKDVVTSYKGIRSGDKVEGSFSGSVVDDKGSWGWSGFFAVYVSPFAKGSLPDEYSNALDAYVESSGGTVKLDHGKKENILRQIEIIVDSAKFVDSDATADYKGKVITLHSRPSAMNNRTLKDEYIHAAADLAGIGSSEKEDHLFWEMINNLIDAGFWHESWKKAFIEDSTDRAQRHMDQRERCLRRARECEQELGREKVDKFLQATGFSIP